MPAPATSPNVLNLIAPGSRVIVRDQDWQVVGIERHLMGNRAIIRCIGRSELVRDRTASFFSELDLIEPEDPTKTTFKLDESPHGLETRLILESLIRRTPEPVTNTNLTVGDQALIDDLKFQREPFQMSQNQLQPRILIADAVGLGKTIEVGIILSELQRRGRADRVLAVVPRHILDQVQYELWTRFAFPLVRLDTSGIQRVRQRIPAGRNPFTYFNRVIISIDTLKQPGRYRPNLERTHWDVIWIDESHKLVNKGTQNNELAKTLAPNADAFILTSATPHNGKSESFAELVSLLDPTAVSNPEQVDSKDIEHLIIRRHRHSPDVESEIKEQWAERAEPMIVSVEPNAAEEKIFKELSDNWLNHKIGPPSTDPLFPYTLLKAALSSPPALTESIKNRLKRSKSSDEKTNTSAREKEARALEKILSLMTEDLNTESAKIHTLIQTLREIGVGPKSEARVVIFSERLVTLDWIAHSICANLGMNEDQVQTFHNSKSDEEQQRIIESFSMAQSSIRVLVSSDIASEGVNLHKQCHNLIHFDLPWSLITLEQRNGRIDRYGQQHQPQVRYLVYGSSNEEIASDIRIITKLIDKENAAHKALGDAASIMGVYSETSEEKNVIEALREKTESAKETTLEKLAPNSKAFDPWAFVGLATQDPQPPASPQIQIKHTPSLFTSIDKYITEGLRSIYHDLKRITWETDKTVISFKPEPDLLRRLEVLPQSYLRQRKLDERLRLTSDKNTAKKSLEYAINSQSEDTTVGTAWPEVHFLNPQHPVIDWLADKTLFRLERNQAIAIPCNVKEVQFLVSAVWSNQLGEPIASTWLAATSEDGLVTLSDMFEAIKEAGIHEDMVNPKWMGSLTVLDRELPAIVSAVSTQIKYEMEKPLEKVQNQLTQTQQKLLAYQSNARQSAYTIKQDTARNKRLNDINRVTQQIEDLIADKRPSTAPLIRIVAALLPKQ